MTRRLAERLYRAHHSVAKFYQFRNRDATLAHGVTPTQCYALFELADKTEDGGMAMSDLAGAVGVEPSSMTRSVDDLVSRGLVRRGQDPRDRRRCLITITPSGAALRARVFDACVDTDLDILTQIAPGSREEVVRAMELLAACLHARRSTCEPDACRASHAAQGVSDA